MEQQSNHNVPHGAIKSNTPSGLSRRLISDVWTSCQPCRLPPAESSAWLQTHLPVLGLVDPLRIGPSKVTLTVEGGDGSTELGHGVEVCGEIVQHGDDVGGERCSLCPLFGHPVHLQGWKKIVENTARVQSRCLQVTWVKTR